MKASPIKVRRQYDATFKREAVANWLGSGKSADVVARELGLSANRLYAWRNLLDPAAAGGRAAAGSRAGAATDRPSQLEAARRANRHRREQRDILKNVGHFLRTVPERYARVQALKADHSILQLCANLQVSPSGYYAWEQRQSAPGPRAREDAALATEVAAIHQQSRQTYGSPRIVATLRVRGRRHGRRRIARLMQHAGLCVRQKGRYRVPTTDSHHDHPIAPNRLAEAPKATAPNQLWVADITSIPTQAGWLYLAAILDLYSRKIVGWARGETLGASLVLQALAPAVLHRDPPAHRLFHSDRGVPYAAGDSRAALAQARLVPP